MNGIRDLWQRGKMVFLSLAGWFLLYGSAFAEQKKETPKEGTYVISYMIVIFTIALGMMAVLRPSRRRDRAKAEVYDEIKIKPKED